MADHKLNLEKARALITSTSDEVNKLLSHDELISAKGYIGERFNQQVNFLNGMVGSAPVGEVETPAFGPVVSFFGKKIERKEAIAPDDTIPSLSEQELFLKERDEFYDSFPDLTDQDIFNKIQLPGGEPIVRSCAKKAGVRNFKTAAIDVLFIGKIRSKVEEEQKAAAALAEAANKIATDTSTTAPVVTPAPALTEEEIAAALADAGRNVGDYKPNADGAGA